jgi:tetratricopeptide (TPR) repeat protein
MRSRRPQNLYQAIETFEKAKAKDPKFVLAYVGLSDAYSLLNLYEIPPPPDAFANAKKNALKALEIDDTLAEAHASLAYILFYGDWNRTEAEKHFRRATELNPSYSTAHHWFALALAAMGKRDESIEQINLAAQLEPKSAVIHSAAGLVYYYARRYEEALEMCRKSLEIDPGFVPALKTMRVINEASGNYEQANEAYSKERNFAGNADETEPGWAMITSQVKSVGGKKDEAAENLQKALSSSIVTENPRGYAFEIAVAYALLGEKENAVKWIETAKNAKDHSFNFVKVDPRLDVLRQERKFQEFTNEVFK